MKHYCNSCGSNDCVEVNPRELVDNPATRQPVEVWTDKTYCNKCGTTHYTSDQIRRNKLAKSQAISRDTYMLHYEFAQ